MHSPVGQYDCDMRKYTAKHTVYSKHIANTTADRQHNKTMSPEGSSGREAFVFMTLSSTRFSGTPFIVVSTLLTVSTLDSTLYFSATLLDYRSCPDMRCGVIPCQWPWHK